MRVRGTAALALIVALVATLAGGTLAQGAPAAQGGAPIRLKAATFTPTLGQSAGAPLSLTRRAPVAVGSGYYLLQFAGPVQQAWKDQLSAAGVELLDYVPDNAFKVRMSPAMAAKARQLGNVSYVGLWHPFYSIDPAVKAAGQQLLRVRVEQGGDAAAVAQAIGAAGASLVGVDNGHLLVVADRAQLNGFAQALDVAWVEPYVFNEKHDEYARTILGLPMGLGSPTPFPYDGSTQIAAVADTGIGGGTAATAHPDIPASRVAGVFNWPGVTDSCFQTIINDGAIDVDSGHGTHVAGSVLSDGGASGEGLGLAPAARLVFQATENYVQISALCAAVNGISNDYYLTGLNDLYGLFQQAYTAGARIHANSWGSSVAGDYTANSATADDFIWDNKDFTITFSAGNSGVDTNADGVVDNDSIGAPATAKNVITIGASENDRLGNYQCDTSLTYTSLDTSYQSGQTCASMGGNQNGQFLGTPRQRWGFTANPIADDLSGGNANQMAAFSSRGPTDDGRIKPDVVAPGTWILSGYSSEFQQGYDASTNPRNNAFQSDGWGIARNVAYKYFGGTSMSNPIAAGAATSVRDFYQKVYGIGASAALVKATLINSAVDMADENNDGINDNDFPIPNVHEGWGRINLAAATDGTAIFAEGAGLATGGTASTTYTASGGAPLKVTLVWSDFASTAAATVNLVNNLELTVTGPGGVVYRGNVFAGGWSTTGGTADNRNNVENVYIQNPTAGASYTVTVSGLSVPQGPQPYALVVRGAQVAPPPPAPAAPTGLGATATSSSQINLSWTDASSNEDGFKIERCQGASCTTFAQIATVGAGVTTYSNTGLTGSTSYSYRVRAYNAGGDSAYSNTASATTQAAPALPAAPTSLTVVTVAGTNTQLRLAWVDNSSNETGFLIERCTGNNCTNFAQVASVATNVTTYTDTGLVRRTTYRYRVRATNAAGNSAYSNTVSRATPR